MGEQIARWRELIGKITAAETPYLRDIEELAAEVERIEAHDRQTQVLADEKCKWFLARAESAETALAEQRIPCTIPPLPDCDYAPPRKASK